MLLLRAEMWVDYNLKNLSIILVNISIGEGIDIVTFRQSAIRENPPGFGKAGLEHIGELPPEPVEGFEALEGEREQNGPPVSPFAAEEGVSLQPQMLEETDQGLQEMLGLLPQIFDDQFVAFAVAQEREGESHLPPEVLGEENGVGAVVDAPELAVENSSVVLDTFDDGGGFEVVVVRSLRQLGETLLERERNFFSRWAGHR
jgi:hypothetical protein